MDKCQSLEQKLYSTEHEMESYQRELDIQYFELEKIRENFLHTQNALQDAKNDRYISIGFGAVGGGIRGGSIGGVPGAIIGGVGGGALGFVEDEAEKKIRSQQRIDDLKKKVENVMKEIRSKEVAIKKHYQPRVQQAQSDVKKAYIDLENCRSR